MADTAPQIPCISVDEIRNAAVSFVGKLDGAEVLTGTPTITEVTTTDLVLTNKQVSTIELVINDATVPIGQAVQFRIDASGAVSGDEYMVKIVVTTDASQTLTGFVRVEVT